MDSGRATTMANLTPDHFSKGHNPLNYDKYRDMENELEKEDIVEFISVIYEKNKEQLVSNLE